MPTIVRDINDNSLVHTNAYVAADLNASELLEQRKELLSPSVKGRMTQWFFEGIRVSHSDLLYTEPNAVEWNGSMDVISMGFNLGGRLAVEQKGSGKAFSFAKGDHNVFYFGESEGIMRNEERKSEMFMIQFTRDAFMRLTENTTDKLMYFRDEVLAGKISSLAEHNETMDFELQSAINAVLNCQYTGGIKKMFFLSKCFEILVLQAQLFDKAAEKKFVYCKAPGDRERIQYARDYLLEHIDAPPTLSALAKVVGVNEFKLKKGFKEVFGTTVFNYLAAQRMETAKIELLQKNKSITELAYELGYSSPQHFSKAFKKVYGVPPGKI
jgi:AraC family transcriptional activator of pyochelin receptor